MKKCMLLFIIILIIIVVDVSPSYCQLLYINICDSSSYQCANTGETYFPKLGLKKNKNLDLFFKDQLIYNKSYLIEKYADMQYEILNDTIVFITFIKRNQTGVSHPMFIEREDVNIVCLNNPNVIYQVNLEKRKIVESPKSLKKFYNVPSDMFYAIINFDMKYLTLISNRNQTKRLKVTVRDNL